MIVNLTDSENTSNHVHSKIHSNLIISSPAAAKEILAAESPAKFSDRLHQITKVVTNR